MRVDFIGTINNSQSFQTADPQSIHTAKQEALYEREENSAIEHLATAYIQTYGIDHGDAVTRIQQDASFWEMRKQVDSFVKKEMGYCNDPEVVITALHQQFPWTREYTSQDLYKNGDFARKILWEIDPTFLECMGKALSKGVTLAALRAFKDPTQDIARNTASNEIWRFSNDKEIVLACVSIDGRLLEFASEDLRNDREVVLAAVRQNGLALEHAYIGLRHDREVVLAAVCQNGLALQYGTKKCRDDEEVAAFACAQNSGARQYATERVQKILILLRFFYLSKRGLGEFNRDG